jgi:hypothetical protein
MDVKRSLGQYAGVYDIVENVTALYAPFLHLLVLHIHMILYSNIRMSNAGNGARIKAWAGSGVGSGIVKNITFKNFIESKVDNPMVIDQVLSFLPLISSFESLILITYNLSAMELPIAIVRNFLQTL